MLRRMCCVCGREMGWREDGHEAVVDSHGYCERCYDEQMLEIKTALPDYPADRPAGRFQ